MKLFYGRLSGGLLLLSSSITFWPMFLIKRDKPPVRNRFNFQILRRWIKISIVHSPSDPYQMERAGWNHQFCSDWLWDCEVHAIKSFKDTYSLVQVVKKTRYTSEESGVLFSELPRYLGLYINMNFLIQFNSDSQHVDLIPKILFDLITF